MTQERIVELALNGAKDKHIALLDGIHRWETERPTVADALKKAMEETVNEIRELEAMKEALENDRV